MIKSYKAGLLTLWEPAHFQFTLFWEQNLLCFLQSLLVCELSFLSYAQHCTACLCLAAHICRMLPLVVLCLRQFLKLCRDLEGKGPLKAKVNFGPFITSSLAVVHGPGNYSFLIAGLLSLSISLYMTVTENIASFAFMVQFIVINQHPFIFSWIVSSYIIVLLNWSYVFLVRLALRYCALLYPLYLYIMILMCSLWMMDLHCLLKVYQVSSTVNFI